MCLFLSSFFFFFFNDTATTEIYTLSLHDALPISVDRKVGLPIAFHVQRRHANPSFYRRLEDRRVRVTTLKDRKSTRLNSSHLVISYAVFCLKKKKQTQ